MLGLEDYGSDDEQAVPKIASKEPPLSSTTRKKPVKFTVELPKSTQDDEVSSRPVKRARTMGSGKSTLLNMLPPPTRTALTPTVGNLSSQHESNTPLGAGFLGVSKQDAAINLIPPSVQKSMPSGTIADSSNDFFCLQPTSKSSTSAISGTLTVPTVSSAPLVADFQPPEPTAEDEYPGYYRLPSGNWAQYDTEYYRSFWQRKQEEWEAHCGSVTQKGFENADEEAHEVSAADQLDHAEKLREEKKNLTRNSGSTLAKPNMNMEAPKGSRARYRHQLTALLSEAYEKRDELEEKIAQARRNRKEAGNKYGF